jgi:hypothetical protein
VDWRSLIEGDSGLAAWRSNRITREAALGSGRAAAIKASLLNYGGVLPSQFKDTYGDISQADLDAAAANPYSTEAMNQKSYDAGIEQMHRGLASRGMLQSGELGYGQDQADYAKGQAEYRGATDFMGTINEILGGYSGGMSGIAGEEGGQISDAEARVRGENPIAPESAAHLVGNSVEQYGFPVYQSQGGDLYRLDPTTGQPIAFTPGQGAEQTVQAPAGGGLSQGGSDLLSWMKAQGYV